MSASQRNAKRIEFGSLRRAELCLRNPRACSSRTHYSTQRPPRRLVRMPTEVTKGAIKMPNQEPMNQDLRRDEHPDSKPYFEGRLTKAILMSLPEGVILQSNVASDPLTPIFKGVLGATAKRQEVWAEMRKLKVTGRLFRGFTTKASYEYDLRQRLQMQSTRPQR